MLARLVICALIFGLGYYLGREMGRTEHVRNTLRARRVRADRDFEPNLARARMRN